MNKKIRPGRLGFVIVMYVAILALYSITLYKMQIYDPARASLETGPVVTTTRTEIIDGARGELLDRNGKLLVSSRPSYSISLSRATLLASKRTNDIIRELIDLTSEAGVTHRDTFPVTQGAPYEYTFDMSSDQRSRLDKYFEFFNLDPEITASDLIVWMKQHYDIPYTVGVAQARMIIGVRYEMEIRVIVNLDPYTFADDLPLSLVSAVSERTYPGVSVTTRSKRVYHTEYAAHLLGYLGRMNQTEMDYYMELGYPMDALVGKFGAELAFEEHLNGKNGSKTVRISENGSIVSEEITDPDPGNNVYLTIDIDLQKTAEDALGAVIENINLDREEGQKATGGSIVVTQVKTGQTLVSASYPSFNPATMQENYTALSEDEMLPLLNRATQGRYSPGSTFKPVTALAALRAGHIGRWTEIEDKGVFTKYDDYRPKCWLYTAVGGTHGKVDVVEALSVSCNYFFYQVGDKTGPSRIAQAAKDFGFGVKTGLEIYEEAGIVDTEEYRREQLDVMWFAADTLLVSIGQGHNMFTPAQLANYTATIANGGTLNDMTILKGVKSPDYTGTIMENQISPRSAIEESGYISILQEGMRAVVTEGTAREVFGNYKVPVAAKTGTVQTGSDVNNGVFICFAPADDPEIALVTVVEKGGSGGAIMEVARLVLDEYFSSKTSSSVLGEGKLLP